MKVVSLLASGTELLAALGAGELLVGRSHECDDPPWVRRLPCVSRPTFAVDGSSGDIDRRVREKLAAGEPLYQVDRALLQALDPDLVITQVHCDVCAVGPAQLADAHSWPGLEGLRTVSMRGSSLETILHDFEMVAEAVERREAGRRLVDSLRSRLEGWRRATQALRQPRVVCLEWTDPPFPMSNWGPELVGLAGGADLLGTPGAHSSAAPWEALRSADPEVLIVAPCGFDLERARAEMPALTRRPGYAELAAVRAGRVFVADGNRYFNRSGPTLFETIGVLAEILHPEHFPPAHQGRVYSRWPTIPAP